VQRSAASPTGRLARAALRERRGRLVGGGQLSCGRPLLGLILCAERGLISNRSIAHEFRLIINSDRMARHCLVQWRKENRLGVAFSDN